MNSTFVSNQNSMSQHLLNNNETNIGGDDYDENGGMGIQVFEWLVFSAILVVLFCILDKTRTDTNEITVDQARANGNAGAHTYANVDPNFNANSIMIAIAMANEISNTVHPDSGGAISTYLKKYREQQEETKKNNISKIFESQHIQQELSSEHIHLEDCSSRAMDKVTSEGCQIIDDHRNEDSTGFSFDEEEVRGTVEFSLPPQVDGKPSVRNSTTSNDDENNTEISVPNLCAICLEEYHEGETIVWSSNKNCPHTFHKDCLTSYFVKVKEKEDYPCPLCRQQFLLVDKKEKKRSRNGNR